MNRNNMNKNNHCNYYQSIDYNNDDDIKHINKPIQLIDNNNKLNNNSKLIYKNRVDRNKKNST